MENNWKHTVQRLFNGVGYEIRRLRDAQDDPAAGAPEYAAPEPVNSQGVHQLNTETDEGKYIVTESLYARIPQQALADFRQFALQNPQIYPDIDHDLPPQHRREILRLGNYHLPQLFNAPTGLAKFNPPDDVHAMVRDVEFCGDLYYCDLVAEILDRAGLGFQDGGRYLDFGCSSGRVVRTLAAQYRNSRFMGCDPNSGAIAWANQEMPNIEFFVSPENPPLALPAAPLDGAYAISIWSHFSARAAAYWLDEMYRVIKPGGFLVFTTHGFGSLIHYKETGTVIEEELVKAKHNLDEYGFHFIDVFGKGGDWGVGESDWGNAFINPAYMLKNLHPHWSLLDFMTRRAEGNQDVYLLKRAG